MKTSIRTLLTLVTLGLGLSSTVFAHTPPSNRQITHALANPDIIDQLVHDADGEQAGAVLLRLLERIQASNASAEQKNYLAAYYSARIAYLMGEKSDALARFILTRAPKDLLPAVFAGLSVGSRGSEAVMAALREIVAENETLLQAVEAPNITLTRPVYLQLLSSLRTTQTIPTTVTDSLPPPVPDGETPPPPPRPRPPVPAVYAGQS